MMETTANNQPHQPPTATENYSDPVEDRWRFLATVLLVLALLAILFIGLSRGQAPLRIGEATVNNAGDVLSWSKEAVEATGKNPVLYTDIFWVIPTERRKEARRRFVLAQDGPHVPPRLSWPDRGATLTMQFEQIDGNKWRVIFTHGG